MHSLQIVQSNSISISPDTLTGIGIKSTPSLGVVEIIKIIQCTQEVVRLATIGEESALS